MYDEFERAVTGRSGERLSFLSWLSIALGTVFALGIVAAGLTAVRVKREVERNVAEITREVRREIRSESAVDAEAMAERLESHTSLLSVPPEEGVTLLQNLDSGSPPEAFMKEFFGGTMELFPQGREIAQGIKDQIREGLLEIDSEEGGIHLDLVRGEDGGSLVINSDDGQVRFDLGKTDDGGFFLIDSKDGGQVRFDLQKGEDGGSLIIQSDDGEVRFDVAGSEDGGTMVIETEDATVRFGAGEDAEGMPAWVPRMDNMHSELAKVYSIRSEEGFMGAVSWQGDGSARDILTFYRDWLSGEGFDLRSQQRTRDGGEEVSSLWARDESSGRVMFLVTGQEDGLTKTLLGYGEKR
jgi:hypothetical protein